MKFHSKPIAEHEQVPLPDDGRWEQLVDHWAQHQARPTKQPGDPNACYVVSVSAEPSSAHTEAQLAEILGLVRAQGDEVVGWQTLTRPRPDPRTFLGRGALEQIAARATDCGADLLVVDAELSPSQTRNLEDITGFSISCREGVILNVFGRHARTRKARIQVEIAHLEYLRPRIRGLGLQMDQQVGGITRGRGPGETASELLARRLDGRLAELRKAFARLERAGQTQRKGRDGCARIVLVGYTNAGKTSLMNALTAADLSARDLPFETLDTTSRCLTRHGGDVVLSDTVGFIRRLPPRLLDSFESTLAEIREATLVGVVIDASDPEWPMHQQTTEAQLSRLGADSIPRFYVFNKMDRVTTPIVEPWSGLDPVHPSMALSSRDPDAIARLRRALIQAARRDHRRTRILVPYEASEVIQRAYATCRVVKADATESGLMLTIEGRPRLVELIERAATEIRS